MRRPPPHVLAAARALRIDLNVLRDPGGASGSTWDAGVGMLRVVEPAAAVRECQAMAAAGEALPVPQVLDRADVEGRTALLIERLPGRTALQAVLERPSLARSVGRTCAALHAVLADVPAPPALPRAAGSPPTRKGRLLHLDLHPLNVLVDEDGAVTGVIDWANAAAGDPALDLARTWSILEFDPEARRIAAGSPGARDLLDTWSEVAGLHRPGAAERRWAVRFLLTDLEGRHPTGDLAHVRRLLDEPVDGDASPR